jgi:hypothetical protein
MVLSQRNLGRSRIDLYFACFGAGGQLAHSLAHQDEQILNEKRLGNDDFVRISVIQWRSAILAPKLERWTHAGDWARSGNEKTSTATMFGST